MDIYISYRKYAQDDRWITVHPNGKEEKGRPVLIDDEGYIKGGLGGKFNEQKYYQIGKNFIGAKSLKKSEMEKRKDEKKFYTSVDDATLGQLNAQIKKIRGFKTTAAITKRTYEFIDKAPVGTCLKGKRLAGKELHYYEKRANGWVKKLDAKDTGVSISEYELGLGIAFGTFWAYRGTELYKSDAKPPMAVAVAKKPSQKASQTKVDKDAIKKSLATVGIQADDSLFKTKGDVNRLTNQIIKLKSDFSNIFTGATIKLDSDMTGCSPKTLGATRFDAYFYDNVRVSLRAPFHSDVKQAEADIANLVSGKWFMPCLSQNHYLYVITHEFGHVIELRIAQREFKKLGLKPSLKWKGSKQEAIYLKLADTIKDEILTKAQKISKMGAGYSKQQIMDDYLSEYGKKNSREFFAECFANSRCGAPNILGEAMNQWLKEKGYQN